LGDFIEILNTSATCGSGGRFKATQISVNCCWKVPCKQKRMLEEMLNLFHDF